MKLKEIINLSILALRVNKVRSILTMLGIIIGVAAVILLVSLGSGLQKYITKEFESLGSNLIFVFPGKIGTSGRGPGGTTVNRLTQTEVKILENKLRNLTTIGPVITKTSTLKFGNKTNKDAEIIGTSANYPQIIKVQLAEGQFFNQGQEDANKRVAVIGQTVKKNLFDSENVLGQKIDISGQRYTVIGILTTRGSVFGADQDNTAIIPISTAQKQFGINNINAIYIAVNSPDKVKYVQNQATSLLEKRMSADDFSVMNQEQTLSTVQGIISVLSLALSGIAAISLLVGGIGIMNIMLVSVTERTREIGLRKAVGARPKDILSQFLIEAVTLSVIGGAIGITLGFLGSLAISRFIPASVTLWSVALAFGFSAFIGIIFGVAPALRASRLNPIDALRYE